MKPKPLAVLNHLTVPLAISSQPNREKVPTPRTSPGARLIEMTSRGPICSEGIPPRPAPVTGECKQPMGAALPAQPCHGPFVKSICVYCGSSAGTDPAFMDEAIACGTLIAEQGLTLVYGGGK